MFTAKDYAMPQSLEEAYEVLMARKTNHIIAGCAWLRMGGKRINTAVDLSQAGLDYIRENDDAVEIGAMTSYRSVETSPVLRENFSGILSKAVEPIIGVQFRNVVTVGGSVYSRFGFSDFLTPLMVLDTQVVFYKDGPIPLAEFMNMPYKKDILEKVVVKKAPVKASTQMFRNAQADFPIVNLAAAKVGQDYKIAVGARPQKAILAPETAQFVSGALADEKILSDKEAFQETCEKAGQILAGEVSFGSNMRAGSQYREKIAKVLLKRAIKEVEGC